MTAPMIMRYEAHLHREWLQAQHKLESMQVRRQGGASSLTRVDITGPQAAKSITLTPGPVLPALRSS